MKNKLCADSGALPAPAWPLAKQRALCYSAFCFKGNISQCAVKHKEKGIKCLQKSLWEMDNTKTLNTSWYCKKRKKKSWKQIRLIAPIILKRIMILYLENKSGTGFHNHMWKTLKGKLDGIAKAVWGQELLPFIFFKLTPKHWWGTEKFNTMFLCNYSLSKFDWQYAKSSSAGTMLRTPGLAGEFWDSLQCYCPFLAGVWIKTNFQFHYFNVIYEMNRE